MRQPIYGQLYRAFQKAKQCHPDELKAWSNNQAVETLRPAETPYDGMLHEIKGLLY